MNDLTFYWRMGNYAIEACPKSLVKFRDDEPNETIDIVKYWKRDEESFEYKYSIGYFYYNEHEYCWELKFVGDRFKDLLQSEDCKAIFFMIGAAYDALTEWKHNQEKEDG